MSHFASRLARWYLAWIFVALGLDFGEKRAALREASGGEPDHGQRRWRFIVARGFAFVLAERPFVFLGFPVAFFVIVASGVARWVRVLSAQI